MSRKYVRFDFNYCGECYEYDDYANNDMNRNCRKWVTLLCGSPFHIPYPPFKDTEVKCLPAHSRVRQMPF